MTNRTCEEIAIELPSYARGILKEDAVGIVDAHLRGCDGCRAELAEVESVERLLRAHLEEIEPSTTFASTFANRLAAEVLAEEEPSRGIFGLRMPAWLAPLTIAAGVAAFVLLGTESTPEAPQIAGTSDAPAPIVALAAPEAGTMLAAAMPEEEVLLAEPPSELVDRADFFVDYAIIENLDLIDTAASAG